MKNQGMLFFLRSVRMLAMASATLFFVLSDTASSADDANELIIAAFMENPVISKELADARRAGYRIEGAYIVVVSEQCGFVGCGYTALVVKGWTTGGANPRSGSIMAMVDISPIGEIQGVTPVFLCLRPPNEVTSPGQQPPVVIEEGVPALPSASEIKERVPGPVRPLEIKERIPGPARPVEIKMRGPVPIPVPPPAVVTEEIVPAPLPALKPQPVKE